MPITATELARNNVLNALGNLCVQYEGEPGLYEALARIVAPLIWPKARRARKVADGYSCEAEGWLLCEFTTTQGKRMSIFEFGLLPGLMCVVPREQVLAMPDMEPAK